MKKLLILTIFLFSACHKKTTSDEQSSNSEYQSTEIQYKSINGIDPDLLSLDVYYSDTNTTKPVVVWVHGGGWCIGDKRNDLDNKKNLFRSLGYVFVSINYRLSPYPYELNNHSRIKFPTHNIDVADAVKWVYQNIENYGGDKNKIVIMGHSAGAQLVALIGTNLDFLQQANVPVSSIKGVAVIDTQAYDIYELTRLNYFNFDMYRNAFGTDSLQNIQASAIRNIQPGLTYPKFFITKRGDSFRLQKINEFIQALQNNNVEVYDVDAGIYSHTQINEAIGYPNENIITPALTDFLNICFQ